MTVNKGVTQMITWPECHSTNIFQDSFTAENNNSKLVSHLMLSIEFVDDILNESNWYFLSSSSSSTSMAGATGLDLLALSSQLTNYWLSLVVAFAAYSDMHVHLQDLQFDYHEELQATSTLLL